jgi:outer membrane protein TolC
MKAVGVLATLVAMGGIASSQPAPQPAAPAAAPTTAPAPATPLAPGATPVAAPVPPAPSGGPGLKLDDAIKLALTRNERAKIAALDIEVAAAGVDKARVAFLPVLQATGNDTIHPRDNPTNTINGALTLNQPLIAPSAFPLYDQAKHELSSQRAQSTDDRRQLAFDAAKAFLNVLLADEVLKAAQRKLETARADLADTDAQVRAQLVSSNDVTRAQIELAGSVREVASDQGTLDAAYVNLALLINQRVSGGLEIPTAMLAAGARPLAAVDGLVAASLVQRPDLIARKETALAAHDFAREPRMRWFPTFGLSGQLTTASPISRNNDDYLDGTIALNATWTIYDAGSRTADARSRDASAEIADLTTTNLARTVEAQVRSAAVSLVSAQQALLAANDAMLASQKSASETAILYHQQLAKAIELLDANEQRFAAEVDYAVAQFAVAGAYLTLRQTMGLEPIGDLP